MRASLAASPRPRGDPLHVHNPGQAWALRRADAQGSPPHAESRSRGGALSHQSRGQGRRETLTSSLRTPAPERGFDQLTLPPADLPPPCRTPKVSHSIPRGCGRASGSPGGCPFRSGTSSSLACGGHGARRAPSPRPGSRPADVRAALHLGRAHHGLGTWLSKTGRLLVGQLAEVGGELTNPTHALLHEDS